VGVPVVVNAAEGSQILVNGNPYLAAYDAVTGAELWQVKGMMGEIAHRPPSPMAASLPETSSSTSSR